MHNLEHVQVHFALHKHYTFPPPWHLLPLDEYAWVQDLLLNHHHLAEKETCFDHHHLHRYQPHTRAPALPLGRHQWYTRRSGTLLMKRKSHQHLQRDLSIYSACRHHAYMYHEGKGVPRSLYDSSCGSKGTPTDTVTTWPIVDYQDRSKCAVGRTGSLKSVGLTAHRQLSISKK